METREAQVPLPLTGVFPWKGGSVNHSTLTVIEARLSARKGPHSFPVGPISPKRVLLVKTCCEGVKEGLGFGITNYHSKPL